MAQLHEQEPVELCRQSAQHYITEGTVRTMTDNMGSGWRHWIERPTPDDGVIGRMAPHTHGRYQGRPRDDSDLVVEDVTPAREETNNGSDYR